MNAPPSPAGVDVLVARFLAFGDVLLTLPLVETLSANPAVRAVDVVTQRSYADLLRRSPYVRRVYAIDPADGSGADGISDVKYDVLLDLHTRAAPLPQPIEDLLGRIQARTTAAFADPWAEEGDGRLPTRAYDEHAVEYYARAAGSLIATPLGSGVIDIAADDLAAAVRRLPSGTVCFAPGARYRFKRWPAERYAALATLLAEAGVPAVLVGHSFDVPYLDAVSDLVRTPTIVIDDDYDLAAVLAASGILVANNSGMAHLGQIAGARVVCVHSHTLPAMWRPWGEGHENVTGVEGPCPCPDLTQFERIAPCGLDIDPGTVADAVHRVREASRE
jgi:ADP-heptose:LPS heptosyltransferase